jgi:tRNA (adenine37-N6)-methyltransferase
MNDRLESGSITRTVRPPHANAERAASFVVAPNTIELTPIATVHAERIEPIDDDWGETEAVISLDPACVHAAAVRGLEQFSHLEVIYLFHLMPGSSVERGARRPCGNPNWPEVGILAQRAKDRPNRLGVSRCQLHNSVVLNCAFEDLTPSTAHPSLTSNPTCRSSTRAVPSGSLRGHEN